MSVRSAATIGPGSRVVAAFRYFFFGTLLPSLRASDSAIAIACLRLLTLPPLPPFPLLAVPRSKRRISRATSSPTPGESLRFLFLAISFLLPNNLGNVAAPRIVPDARPNRPRLWEPRAYARDRTSASVRAHPRRARLARHFEALAGVGDLGAVDAQDRKVTINVIADIDVF